MQVIDLRNADVVIRIVKTNDDAVIDKLVSAMKSSQTLLANATIFIHDNSIYIKY